MKHIVAILLLFAILGILAYALLSPAYLGDYRWVLLALPVSLLLAREVYERASGLAQQYWLDQMLLQIEPVPDSEIDDADDENDWPEVENPYDLQVLGGFWTGSVSLWPSHVHEELRVLPLHLAICPEPLVLSLIPAAITSHSPHVQAARLLEYDTRNGNVDLEVQVGGVGAPTHHTTHLVFRDHAIESEDDTESVTVELRRARLVPVDPNDPPPSVATIRGRDIPPHFRPQ